MRGNKYFSHKITESLGSGLRFLLKMQLVVGRKERAKGGLQKVLRMMGDRIGYHDQRKTGLPGQ